jgi:hypothetical protein
MVRKYNRVMDKFKISFRCSKQPNEATGLMGFEQERAYIGRTYNGLFEISTEWGSGKPTVLLDRKIFERYFELIGDRDN